jgi:acyl-CoA synthetase (AMP-forming)/AMP-acid ligase II
MIIRELIKEAVERYSDKVAELGFGRPYTFTEINERANRLANALIGIGLAKGDRLSVISKNCPQFREVYLAGAKTGIIIVPLNNRLQEKEIAYMIGDCQPITVIVQEDYINMINSICSKPTSIKNIICLGRQQGRILSYEELLSASSADEPQVDISEDDLYVIQYTSGTTGKPKGVMLTQKNACANSLSSESPNQSNPDSNEVVLGVMPMHGSAGCFSDLLRFLSGATSVMHEKFDTAAVLRDIQEFRVTSFAMVPTMLKMILDDPNFENTDLSSLRSIAYAGSPMPPELLSRAMKALPNVGFRQGLGSTETIFINELTEEDHIKMRKLDSVGKPIPGVEVKIVNEEGKELPSGEIGIIAVRSNSVMKGYWGLPEATAMALRDGWYYSNDMGYIDEDGYLYIRGRKEEVIISGGYNIYPMEIENVILSHPAVSEVAVIGVPDPEWVESVKALVVLKERTKASEDEIIQLCKDNLASFKKPRTVEFVDSLPKTATGKVMKVELRARYSKNQ